MADSFAAPSGPPPPKVPAGWKAQWNEQYSEWFYVNIYTRKSQWDKPNEPVYPSGDGDQHSAPSGPPPSYDPSTARQTGPEKAGELGSNNPYGSHQDLSEDERLARQLQAEEDARASKSQDRGASDSYYGGGSGSNNGYGQSSSQASPGGDKSKSRGLASKLFGSKKPAQQQPPLQSYGGGQGGYGGQGYQQQGYPQQGYQQQGYPPQGYPQQGGYGGGYQGYPQQGYPQQQRKSGLGTGGALALGAGGGLLGGMLLGEAMDGGDDGGDGGGDYGGGDGGGDFGGGDGGGDF